MIPYYRPYFNCSELLAAARPGDKRDEFESALAARVGARYGVSFAYGHSGFIASLKALGLTQTQVLLPAYTCAVMAEAVLASNNQLAFADITLSDYNMDLVALKRALNSQTRVVVATHMYGYPANVDAIRSAIGDERVIIIEDCAQGLLTFSPGTNKLRGDLGLFSFGPGKTICTVRGGLIATNSPELYEKIRAYRDKEMNQYSAKTWAKRLAWLLASYLVFQNRIYGLQYRYRHRRAVQNVHPSSNLPSEAVAGDMATAFYNFQARVGLAQLHKLDDLISQRRALARLYDQELRGAPGISPAPIIDGATYTFYSPRVSRRDEMGFKRRMADCGVSVTQSYSYALPYLKPYQPFAQQTYPQALQAAREVVNLPLYPNQSPDDVRFVAQCARRCAQES
jgi:perosamine synthetase